tara:strand:+ start:166 stop:561 length:396 start_codon:yes stop_codon:yes gene_type:complete
MKTEATEKIKEREDDKPDYQEKIMFLVSTSAQGAILAWCLIVLSLGYIKLPNRLFGMDIPDQPRVDSTFAAGLLGNILAGWGVSVGAASGSKKKKKEEEQNGSYNKGAGEQIIVIRQPIELITSKPDVSKS